MPIIAVKEYAGQKPSGRAEALAPHQTAKPVGFTTQTTGCDNRSFTVAALNGVGTARANSAGYWY
jgi:hypothetical protein